MVNQCGNLAFKKKCKVFVLTIGYPQINLKNINSSKPSLDEKFWK